jgi:hypothetical protein
MCLSRTTALWIYFDCLRNTVRSTRVNWCHLIILQDRFDVTHQNFWTLFVRKSTVRMIEHFFYYQGHICDIMRCFQCVFIKSLKTYVLHRGRTFSEVAERTLFIYCSLSNNILNRKYFIRYNDKMLVNDEQGMMLTEEVWPNLRYSLGFATDGVKSRNQIFNLGTDIWKECAIHSTFLTIASTSENAINGQWNRN